MCLEEDACEYCRRVALVFLHISLARTEYKQSYAGLDTRETHLPRKRQCPDSVFLLYKRHKVDKIVPTCRLYAFMHPPTLRTFQYQSFHQRLTLTHPLPLSPPRLHLLSFHFCLSSFSNLSINLESLYSPFLSAFVPLFQMELHFHPLQGLLSSQSEAKNRLVSLGLVFCALVSHLSLLIITPTSR